VSNQQNPAVTSMLPKLVHALTHSRNNSSNTQYECQFGILSRWCQQHRLTPLPAAPLTVALFLISRLDDISSFSALNGARQSISSFHTSAGVSPNPCDDSIVTDVLNFGKRQLGDFAANKKLPLTLEQVQNICVRFAATGCSFENLMLLYAVQRKLLRVPPLQRCPNDRPLR
jgi:hypothetical protein